MGVLDHGRHQFDSYLCMPSAQSGANLTIDCFHRTLENWMEEKGKVPKKIYWQIDGAGDNANLTVLAYCEYILNMYSIEEIVLSRLPVGHTHEDIDAHFGIIWEHCRLAHIHTVDEYCSYIRSSFPKKKVRVMKVFSVNDYELFFSLSTDKIKYFAKLHDTKLCFRFVLKEGKSQCSYRAFAADTVLLIIGAEHISEEDRSQAAATVGYQVVLSLPSFLTFLPYLPSFLPSLHSFLPSFLTFLPSFLTLLPYVPSLPSLPSLPIRQCHVRIDGSQEIK